MDNKEKKVLLQISNLKQYFPVGKRGLAVKANDGITINIYEGETFGLVGESGCGKSTLGRSILQLYKQTDGRTMYFGRSIDEVAPKYAYNTYRKLASKKVKMLQLRQEYEAFQAEYDKLEEKEQYAKHSELTAKKKLANDAMLDLATLIGGLVACEDLAPVSEVFLEEYKLSKKLTVTMRKQADAKLVVDDAVYAEKKAAEAGKSTEAKAVAIKKAQEKLAAIDEEVANIHKELATVHGKIDALRAKNRGIEGFDYYDAYRSTGIDLARLTYDEMRHLRSDLQLIFQDPYSSLNPRMTVGQIVGEGMIAHKFFRKADERMQDQVIQVMEDCGLAPYFIHRFPHQFSGGQRQRIGIARSLALEPKFVVCDEAVSALDVSIQAQVINLLLELKEKKHLTYMFITHDLSVVKYISDRIGVMYLGNMVELADSDDMFAHPMHPYTEALLKAIPTTDDGGGKAPEILEGDIPSPVNPPKGCKFHTRCKYCTDKCTQVVPELRELRPEHFVACHHPLMDKA